MKILFLSQRVPYPPNRGDKIATWPLIERMRRDHEVEVLALAHDEDDVKGAEDLRKMGFSVTTFRHRPRWDRIRALPLLATRTPMTLGVYGSAELRAEMARRAPGADLAYAYSSSMGAFMMPHDNLKRVMHFAELDSDKWRQYSERKSFPASWVYRREWRTLWAYERKLAAKMDSNVFCTPLEQKIFQEKIPGHPSIVQRNGVDLEGFRPAPEQAQPGHIIFVGVMNYYPNVDGCIWFVNEILPRIRERVPEARLSIVGSRPSPEIEALAKQPGVTVTGFVDDTRDWLRRAQLSIAPLRVARGIQNKVLEAMAMGLPVVGTTSATQGVAAEIGHHYLVEDEVEGQVEAICGLLRDPEKARQLGANGRDFVEKYHDWDTCLKPIDELLERLAGSVARQESKSA